MDGAFGKKTLKNKNIRLEKNGKACLSNTSLAKNH
jgi:hypothetical protein